MANITSRVLEDMMAYNNEITCVKESIGTLLNTDLLVVSNLENGSTMEEINDPFYKLFNISAKKTYSDIEYVRQQKPSLAANIGDFYGELNVYDLDTFLRALVPNQTQLIKTLTEQCNVHPKFTYLTRKLDLLRTVCSQNICQGKILASSKFTLDGCEDICFPIAHPPFVYEIHQLLKLSDEKAVETYFKHLHNYLMTEIEVKSCLLCLTFDMYGKNDCSLRNFRLFFTEKNQTIPNDFSIEALYESKVEMNPNEQHSIFDDVLERITIVKLGNDKGGHTQFLHFKDSKKKDVTLYF